MMELNHYHVLLVEDNPLDVKVIKQFFKQSKAQTSFKVHSVDSLKSAIDYIKINEISAILLDLNLTDSFGIDTFLHIKKTDSEIPVVILTATDDERLALLAVRQGAQDYLLKTDLSCSILTRAIEYSVERKTIENDLAAVKAGQLAIIENTEDSIWSVDVHGNFQIVNSKFKKFYRSITGSDVRIGKNMLVQLPESFHNDWKNLLVKALEGNQLLVYQSYKLDNYNQHDYEIAVNPIIKEHQIVGASFFARNISDRRKFEKKLIQSERAYRMLVESVNDGVVMISNENNIQVINNNLLKHLEFDEKEVIGLDYRLLLARTSELTKENITAYVLNSEDPFKIILKSKSGKKVMFSVKGTPLMDENGEVAGALLMHSNIKKSNLHGGKQGKAYSNLVDKLSEGLVYVDNDNKVQYANSKFCELLGLEYDELIDKPLFTDMVDERTKRILSEKKLLYGASLADHFELKLTKRTGEDLWVQINGNTVYDENNQSIGSVSTLADITKRKIRQV
ncbi:MAG: PAS domain S-box protein, partial [Bacteroidia bacterium]|nr:PAS domain S-box protein [Bacteroidia bacterium]